MHIANSEKNGSPLFARFSSLRQMAPRAAVQGAISVANFVLIQVAARAFDTTEFGLLSITLAVSAAIFLVLFSPICEGINRFVHEAIRNARHDEFLRTAGIFLGGAALVVAALYAGSIFLLDRIPHPQEVTFLFVSASFTFYLTYSFANVAASYYGVRRKYILWLTFGFAIPLGTAVIVWITAKFFVPSILVFLVSQSLLTVLLFISFNISNFFRLVKSYREISNNFRDKRAYLLSNFFGFIWPFPFLTAARFIFTFSDRFTVAEFFTLRDVGTYGYMYTLTTTLVGAASTIYYAATYLRTVENLAHANVPEEAAATIRRFAVNSALFPLLFSPLAVLFFFWDQGIAKFVLGQRALIPAGCLPLLLISAALYFGSEQLSLTGNLYKRLKIFLAVRWIFAAILVIALLIIHPSLYAISVVMVTVNSFHFGAVAIVAWWLTSNPP